MKILALRLKPKQDLKDSLKNFVKEHNIQAGFIITAVGSLQQATLRFANRNDPKLLTKKLEILSLVGTLSIHGMHLHISLANQNGKTIGGHLMDGCLIYTTAEIIIGTSEDFIFQRTVDKQTGYQELTIEPINPQ